MNYETVIGLEIHAQLLTESKMFCACSAKFGDRPNTNICPICTGQPGALPRMNSKAIEFAIKTALALKCKIEGRSVFARKNYFYPDLPKNYQISQYDQPLATNGSIEIEVAGATRKIGITRVHLEEDAGKLVHKGAARIMGASESLVDLNRTGTPLMEIVSEPDIRSPEEAKEYVEELANLLKQLGVCDAKLEEGSLRCDANISLRPVGETKLGVKSEIKNLNSFRSILKALEFEIKRQTELLNSGGKVVQETRYFDDTTDTTASMRSKEFAHDYRYFPEPDLVPVEPDQKWVEEIMKTIGELPAEKRKRYEKEFGLPAHDAKIIASSIEMWKTYEKISEYVPSNMVVKWLIGPVRSLANKGVIKQIDYRELRQETDSFDLSHTSPPPISSAHPYSFMQPASGTSSYVQLSASFSQSETISLKKVEVRTFTAPGILNWWQLTEVLMFVNNKTINEAKGKELLEKTVLTGQLPEALMVSEGMQLIVDEALLKNAVEKVLKINEKTVLDYKSGKTQVFGFLLGQAMKELKGSASPNELRALLNKMLENIS